MGRHLQLTPSIFEGFPVKIRICLLEFLLFIAEASGGSNEVELPGLLFLQVTAQQQSSLKHFCLFYSKY